MSENTIDIEIDVQSTKQLLDNDQIVLIDCREAAEYEVARIEGSVLLPMSQWAEVSVELEGLVGRHLVVHCHHGGRSLRVTKWLRENGFPNAQNMSGGIDAWSDEIDRAVPKY